ncbi:MAG: CPBP family intramembrane metalloprotease [Candidatus Lokiarchaeota archaeon]|nr:CPBP family intramembrane metalloprotease [Candidatus Lokiarchaeota archaeon]
MLWKSGQGKKNAFLSLASVGISFGMLILGSMLIRLQEIVFSAVFGEAALQQARDNLNQFVIVQPSFMDVVIFGATSFLVIALNEELFFRAFLLRVAGPSRVGGSLISASLFAAYHLVTSMSVYSIVFMVPYYFSWGLVLSAEYLASGEQLVFPILTHGSFNLLLLML